MSQRPPRSGSTEPGPPVGFLDELRWPGMPKVDPLEAASAVLCVLERRLSGAERIAPNLPPGLRELLARCARHAAAPAQRMTRHQFLADVAAHLDLDQPAAETVVRAVFSSVRDRMSEEDVETVSAQLPEELADLWWRAV